MLPANGPPTLSRILLIEDEPKVARALQQGLAAEGHDVTAATTAEQGLERAASQAFDLLILDRTLPGQDGIAILSTLRARGLSCPVLLLTARDALPDRLAGMDAGADDYLVKPFAFSELLARVLALLRRTHGEANAKLCVADLVVDVAARSATRAGRALELSPREYEILEYLVRHRDTLVSREMLAGDLWQEGQRGTPVDDVIDVHMARLCRKVDEGCSARLINSVRGVGFVVREGAD
jgi:two-component system copper resistance phosphate regulon response regulator CusR